MLKKIIQQDYYLTLIILVLSILINQHYGFIGVNPLDNFTIYHSGNLILNGQKPFEDYWITTGLTLDLIQYFFFKILGINWSAYVLHASIFNGIFSVVIFTVLKSFELEKKYCFFYAILTSILFYPAVATPFVDHHSIFFSIISVFLFILGIKNQKKGFKFWFSIPILLALGFLSKQTPSSFIILLIIIFSIYFYLVSNNTKILLAYFLSSALTISIFLLCLKFSNIDIINFYEQYIKFPSTIGKGRASVDGFLTPVTFSRYILKFKYIHLLSLPLIFSIIFIIKKKKLFYKEKDFIIILTVLSSTYILIIHQLLTLNAKYIYFIIPFVAGFSQIYVIKYKFKYSKIFVNLILFFVILSSSYYSHKYIHSRNFLISNNLYNKEKIFETNILDNSKKKFYWITHYNKKPKQEVESLESAAKYLKVIDSQAKGKYLLITDYQFLIYKFDLRNALTINKLYGSGISYPSINNPSFNKYKIYFKDKLIKNKVDQIYFIKPSYFNEEINALNGIIKKDCVIKFTKLNLIGLKNIKNCI